jgi:hypothetical protein
MAIPTDRMGVSPQPNHWDTRGILLASVALAAGRLVFSLGAFLWGHYRLGLDMPDLQSLTFVYGDFHITSGRVFVARAGTFLAIEPLPFRDLEFGLGRGCHHDSMLGRPARAGDPFDGVVGCGACVTDLLFRAGLVKDGDFCAFGFALSNRFDTGQSRDPDRRRRPAGEYANG